MSVTPNLRISIPSPLLLGDCWPRTIKGSLANPQLHGSWKELHKKSRYLSRPEKHVDLSNSAAERPILRDDEQTQVLKKVNEINSELAPELSQKRLGVGVGLVHTPASIPEASAAAAQAHPTEISVLSVNL